MSKVIIAKTNLKLSAIPAEKIFTSEKTGEKYLAVTIVINEDLNQFDKQGPVSVEQTLEERTNKQPKTYLGDVEVVYVDGYELQTTKQLKELKNEQ